MAQLIDTMQMKLKSSSVSLVSFTLRIISGLLLGLVFTLIGKEIFAYGNLMFFFVIVSITAAFMRVSKAWSAPGVLLFDLVFILIALLLRMYIVIAPG